MEKIIEADASELVAELTTPSPSEAFSLFKPQPDGSKKEFKLRMRMLREEETIAVLREAQAYTKEMGELPKDYGDIYKEAQACALIAKSLCRAEKRTLPNGTDYFPQLFTSTAQLRASFTENEIAVCLNAHEVLKAKYRCFEDWKPHEVDQWATRLSDTLLGPFWLGRLDSAHWPALIYALAEKVCSLSALLGQTLSVTDDTSESSQDNSSDGTGGSQPLPHVVSSAGEKLPDDRLMTREEAIEAAKNLRSPKK